MDLTEEDTEESGKCLVINPVFQRKQISRGNTNRGDINFCPYNSNTRVLSQKRPLALHNFFTYQSAATPFLEISSKYRKTEKISPLKIVKNSGSGVKDAVRKHNPVKRHNQLQKKLQNILKKPKDIKKKAPISVYKKREKSNNTIDKLIQSSIDKKKTKTKTITPSTPISKTNN